MLGSEARASELLVDNQSSIALSKNLVFHDRSKHIDVWYHFICQCVDECRIKLGFVATEQQMVDVDEGVGMCSLPGAAFRSQRPSQR
jgi:hypothetical protein